MATYFFHDQVRQIVYQLGPVFVSPQFSNHRPPRYQGCHVRGHLSWVSATWQKVEGNYCYEFGHQFSNSYDERDDVQRAEHWFVTVHVQMGRHAEIDQAQYDALAVRYAASAKQTPQPEPEPPPPTPQPPVRRRRRRR